MTIDVSLEDINNGLRGNGRFCPVANALHRHGYINPTVTRSEVRLPDGRHFTLPKPAVDAIRRWDGDETRDPQAISPFSFEV